MNLHHWNLLSNRQEGAIERVSLKKAKCFVSVRGKGQPSAEYKTFTQFAQLCYHNNENRLTDADFYAEYYTDIVKLYAPEDIITPKREN